MQAESIPEGIELPPSKFAHCATLQEPERIDAALYTEARLEHQPAPGLDVYEEVPVSPLGCVRYFQEIKAGRLVSIGVVRAEGLVEGFVASNGEVAFREREVFLSRETRTETGYQIELDVAGDGQPDVLMTATYDDAGLVEQVISFFSPSSGRVAERRVLRRVDAATARWTEEKLVAGALVKTRDDLAPAKMEADSESPGDCYIDGAQQNVRCDADDRKKIEEQLQEALKKGSECLQRQQAANQSATTDRELLQHLIKTRGQKLFKGCFEGGNAHAYVDLINNGGPTGERLVMVNVGTLRCQSDRFVASTLFHEVLHITRGPHSLDSELTDLRKEGKMSHEAYSYTDSIRACEAFCFEDLKNRCSCAACFQVSTCDALCANEASCAQQDLSGKYVMSEAVGALCVYCDAPLAPGPDSTPCSSSNPLRGKPSWSATMEACKQTCGPGGTCKSYSRSCNTNCN